MKEAFDQETKNAYLRGARDMMRAFMLSDPGEYAQMCSSMTERHIRSILLKGERLEREVRHQDIRNIIRAGYMDTDEARYILSSRHCANYPGVSIYKKADRKEEIYTLKLDNDLAIHEVFYELIRTGNLFIIEEIIASPELDEKRQLDLEGIMLDVMIDADHNGEYPTRSQLDTDAATADMQISRVDSGQIKAKTGHRFARRTKKK